MMYVGCSMYDLQNYICLYGNFTFYHTGLCRTCEIFGVSQVVLNSTNIIEDSQFQALSVSAEKWVPITQVCILFLSFVKISK